MPDDDDVPGAPNVGHNQSDNDGGGQHNTLYDKGNDNHISWDTDVVLVLLLVLLLVLP